MREMTRKEHRTQRDLILASLLLADTRSERHGVYARRAMQKKVRRYALPVVTEKPPL